ncbi:MAG: hypothetical protein IKN56_06525, partial [Clostridia bacterium]|nr:hypothetical protein [Clostridia bacterium]
MKKSVLFITLICTIVFALIIPASGNSTQYVNGDSESFDGAVFYCVESETGYIYSETAIATDREYITGYRADRVAALSGNIYVLTGNEIHIIDNKSLTDIVLVKTEREISRFAVTGNSVYYLSSGNIYSYNKITNDTNMVIMSGEAEDFWLED